MPRRYRRKRFRLYCERCGRRRDAEHGEEFSARGICRDCMIAAVEAQHAGAREQVADPAWLASWRRGMARSAGALLREDVPSDS